MGAHPPDDKQREPPVLRDESSNGGGQPGGPRNVLGELLDVCSISPMTGFYRDGCCDTGQEDIGSHTVCAVMTAAFLDFSKSRGDADAGARFSGAEARRPLVFMCIPLAGGIRSRPSAPRRSARYSQRCSGILLARRPKTACSGPGLIARFHLTRPSC